MISVLNDVGVFYLKRWVYFVVYSLIKGQDELNVTFEVFNEVLTLCKQSKGWKYVLWELCL